MNSPFPFLAALTVLCFGTLSLSQADSSKSDNLLPLTSWKAPGEWAQAKKAVGSTSEKKWQSIEEGEGILYNGKAGKTNNIVSVSEYGDVEMEVEFMIPKGSNSGIYLMQRYEVQILDSCGKPDEALKYGDCGGIYERWDDSKEKNEEKGYEGTAPSTNAATSAGSWQTFRIQFRAPRFDAEGKKIENARFVQVQHNGVVIHEDVEVTGPTRGGVGGPEVTSAPLMIQGDHGPIAFRKLTVTGKTFE